MILQTTFFMTHSFDLKLNKVFSWVVHLIKEEINLTKTLNYENPDLYRINSN